MSDMPKIDNAPGIVWKKRRYGWQCAWHARTDLVRRGWAIKSLRLWGGPLEELTENAIAFISHQCRSLQTEMLVWGRGGIPHVAGAFDGTVRSLSSHYQSDPDSTFSKNRFTTREHYEALLRRIEADCGDDKIADIKARNILRLHESWSEGGKIAMAHGLVGMLRTLVNFGATILEDAECERLAGVLHKMKFAMPKARTVHLTSDQANAIRAMAHKQGQPWIALAQAFQFELMLRQKDVIGEWVPIEEPGHSEVTSGNMKWLRGLRWSEIDDKLILRHTTSKKLKDIEVDLRNAPMVVEELKKLGTIPRTGPVIVTEHGKPFARSAFRVKWRIIADLCGIPKHIRNMDTRAGAITEATDAGADIESVRHAATHSNSATTMRYSRNPVEKGAVVQMKRAAYRNKTGN